MKSSAAPGVATAGAEPRGQMSGWAFWLASHARCLWFVGVSVRLGWKKGSCNQNQSLEPTALKSQDLLPLPMEIWVGLPVSLFLLPGALYPVSATPQGCPCMALCRPSVLPPSVEGHEGRAPSSFHQPWRAPRQPHLTPTPYLRHLLLAHFSHWPGSGGP